MMNRTQHTTGPLAYERLSGAIFYKDGDVESLVASTNFENAPVEQGDADGRLLAAAYTSYDKHCGPRSIECAEGDLLGEALQMLREAECAVEQLCLGQNPANQCWETLKNIRALLAKAEGKA